MILKRNLMLALSVIGGVAIAAVCAVLRNERRLKAEQYQTELQVWENETGSFAPAVVKRPP